MKKLFTSVLALAIAFTPVATQQCFATETQPQVEQTTTQATQTAEESVCTKTVRFIGCCVVAGCVGACLSYIPIPSSIPIFLVTTPCTMALNWLMK